MRTFNFLIFSFLIKTSSFCQVAGDTENEFPTNFNELRKDELNMAQIYGEYFRYYKVRNVMLVVCERSLAARHAHIQIINYFNSKGILMRIFNGDDYFTKDEPFPAVKFINGVIPPQTFRTDNDTRRPIHFKPETPAFRTGVLMLEFQTPCALNVLRWGAAKEHNLFTTNRYWLLIAENPEQLALLEDKEIFLPPDGEVRVITYSNTFDTFNLTDVYKVHPERPLKQRHIDTALSGNIYELLKALQTFGLAMSYRQNLEGITFNTGLVIAFPDVFTGIDDTSLRHIDTISKVNYPLTRELANTLNIRFNTYQMDNYGWRQPNGSFDGLMGMFSRYELDFAHMAIFMRLDRTALVDFVGETYRIRAGLIFRQPPLSAVSNIFALPFDHYVWISIFILMIFTIFVFCLELNFSPHHHDMDFWDCVVFVWGAMCQQGFYVTINNRSGRIVVFSTFVATLFLFTSFSANIVALLQSPSEAITSLSELSLSPLDIGVQETQYNKIYFTESSDPVTTHLYKKKIAPKGEGIYMRPRQGIQKMRTGLFAYQVELQAGYQIISETFSEPEKCGLKELEPFQLPMISVPTRKNFPYKELFRQQIRWQREVGIMKREELKWIPQKPKCEGGVGGFVSIGLTECRYALAMFGFGFCLGIAVFWLEIVLKCATKLFVKLKNLGKIEIEVEKPLKS